MSAIAAAVDSFLNDLRDLASAVEAKSSEKMVMALLAERDAVLKRAEKAEATVKRLMAQAEPVAWRWKRNGASEAEWAFAKGREFPIPSRICLELDIEPLYASVTDRPEAELRAETGAAMWMAAIEAVINLSDAPLFDAVDMDEYADFIRAIPMPTDAAAALDRMTARARVQGMREAARICEEAGSSKYGRDCDQFCMSSITFRADQLEKEATDDRR